MTIRLTDVELLKQTRVQAKEYLSLTRQLLESLFELDQRKLWAGLSYGSLFQYMQMDLGFCNATADRKLKAVRMMRVLPEVALKVETGSVTLTAVANLQRAIEHEERRTRRTLPLEKKAELLERIEHQSTPQVEKLLAIEFPELPTKLESIRATGDDQNRLSLTLTEVQLEKLRRIQSLTAHADFNATIASTLEHVMDDYLKRHDPMKLVATPTQASEKQKRALVFKRDHGRCTFIDPRTGRKCGSSFQLEIDHIKPKGLGGTDDIDNLRVYCRAHNQYAAQQTFGALSFR